MKTVVVTKMLDQNHIELREYWLFKQPLKVVYCENPYHLKCNHILDPYMIFSVAKQKKGKVVNTQQSKFPPYSYYRMYKFLWKPIKPISYDGLYRFDGNQAIKI